MIKLNYTKIENFYPTRDITEITFLKSLKMEKIFIIYRAGEGSVSRKYKESLQINQQLEDNSVGKKWAKEKDEKFTEEETREETASLVARN